jgi:hypothetical protein
MFRKKGSGPIYFSRVFYAGAALAKSALAAKGKAESRLVCDRVEGAT